MATGSLFPGDQIRTGNKNQKADSTVDIDVLDDCKNNFKIIHKINAPDMRPEKLLFNFKINKRLLTVKAFRDAAFIAWFVFFTYSYSICQSTFQKTLTHDYNYIPGYLISDPSGNVAMTTVSVTGGTYI